MGIVLSIATDDTRCTPRDPSVCGPDLAFAWAVPLLVVGLVTLWTWPLVASALVLGYVGLDLAHDPARPARVAFAVLGLLVLGYAGWHVALARHQRAIMASSAGPAHRPVLVPRSWPRTLGALVTGGGCALVAVASGAWYVHQVDATAGHLASSVVVDSVAGGLDGDGDQSFTLTDPPAGAPRTVHLLTAIADYPEGSHQPVRVDRDDPGWVRLVAEPDDHTPWLSLALGAGFLGALVLSYDAARALSRRRLGDPGWSGVDVSVRVIGGEVWVSAADASHTTLATFETDLGQDELSSRPGVLVGDLRARGWAAVWTADALLLPLRRLSVEGGPEPMTDSRAEVLRRQYEEEDDWQEDDWQEADWGREDVPNEPRPASRWSEKLVGRTVSQRLSAVSSTLSRWSESRPVAIFYRLLGVVLGAFLIWSSGPTLGPAWSAAHGEGVPGTMTVTQVDCGSKGPCHHSGTFRSDDGEHVFTDVSLVNGGGEVGEQVRALYEGDGEDPEEVYGPGWGGFAENVLYVGMGLSFLVFSFGGVLERILLRRRPGGRHARPV